MSPRAYLSHAAAVILQALANGYQYGFDIMDITGLPSGTVYPALRRLEQTGLIDSKWEKAGIAQREVEAFRPVLREVRDHLGGCERCQAELRWEVGRFHLDRPPSEEERQKLDDLKGQADRMGAINLTAIEEYDELSKRHTFMNEQKNDLERSLEDHVKAGVLLPRLEQHGDPFDADDDPDDARGGREDEDSGF